MKQATLLIGLGILAMSFVTGCVNKLEPGGAYAPITISTNADGTTITNATQAPDMGFISRMPLIRPPTIW